MIKIPKSWIKHLENASNHCQTFLSSCCLIDYEKEHSEKIRILSHNTGERKDFELPLSPKNKIDEYKPINVFKKPTSQIPQTKFSPPNHNPTPIDTDELLKRLKLLHLFPKLSKQTLLTPFTSPNIRSTTPSPKPTIYHVALLTRFSLERAKYEIKALQELAKIERNIIQKFRQQGESRS